MRKLSDAFVHPGVGFEVVAAGLNAIREVCRRQPWCMDATLLEDLIEYRKSKDKGVTAAARGLLQLYREVNPELLRRKERGKAATMGLSEGTQARPFGQPSDTVQGIEGLELLEAHLEEEAAAKAAGAAGDGVADEGDGEDADAGWEGWELESDGDSDDSGGWISVSSGSDNESAFEISDSEDENDHKNGKKGDAARKACRALERKVKKTGDAASLAGEEESADENQMEEDGVVKGESVGPEAKEAGEIAEQAQKEEQKISTLAMTKVSSRLSKWRSQQYCVYFLNCHHHSPELEYTFADSHPRRFRQTERTAPRGGRGSRQRRGRRSSKTSSSLPQSSAKALGTLITRGRPGVPGRSGHLGAAKAPER